MPPKVPLTAPRTAASAQADMTSFRLGQGQRPLTAQAAQAGATPATPNVMRTRTGLNAPAQPSSGTPIAPKVQTTGTAIGPVNTSAVAATPGTGDLKMLEKTAQQLSASQNMPIELARKKILQLFNAGQ